MNDLFLTFFILQDTNQSQYVRSMNRFSTAKEEQEEEVKSHSSILTSPSGKHFSICFRTALDSVKCGCLSRIWNPDWSTDRRCEENISSPTRLDLATRWAVNTPCCPQFPSFATRNLLLPKATSRARRGSNLRPSALFPATQRTLNASRVS